MSGKPRIAVVTPFFPIQEESFRGHSAYQCLRRMTGEAEIEVFCPLAAYPKVSWLNPRSYRYYRTNLNYSPPDLKAHYFEYPAFPWVTRPVNWALCLRPLMPRLRKFQPDLLFNYWLYPEGYATIEAGRRLGVPVIVRSIGSDIRRIPDTVTRYFTQRTLRQADMVLTASTELQQRAIELGAPKERCQAILNGCDITVFHPMDRQQARHDLQLNPEAEIVIFVGTIISSKGLLDLLGAMERLASRRPRLEIHCIGSGPLQKDLEERVKQARLAGRFQLPGRQTSAQVAQWMAASDLFCLPSHSEGCPNVVIEAIASGRPVLGTDVGGIPELVDHESGILVPPHSPDKLAEALDSALSRNWDPAVISRKYLRSWEQVAKETLAVCTSVLESRRART